MRYITSNLFAVAMLRIRSMQTPQCTAVIADIHGNSWALDAVLADIDRRGITQIINLGDTVYGSLDPAGTAARLMARPGVNIRGNQDRIVPEPDAATRATSDYQYVRGQLSVAQIEWVRAHQPSAVVGALFCCHGTPTSDESYLLETVTPHGIFLAATETILRQVERITQPVILCGHSHVPRTVWLPDGRLIVNPGSVGIPAYDHDVPYPHVMEAGSPHARYAVITQTSAGFAVEQVALPYRWEQAAAAARRQGRADRAGWLTTGRAQLAI